MDLGPDGRLGQNRATRALADGQVFDGHAYCRRGHHRTVVRNVILDGTPDDNLVRVNNGKATFENVTFRGGPGRGGHSLEIKEDGSAQIRAGQFAPDSAPASRCRTSSLPNRDGSRNSGNAPARTASHSTFT